MNFLTARKIVENFTDGTPLSFTLAMSGIPDQLLFYLRAHAMIKGFEPKIKTLPFGTLQQFLLQPNSSNNTTVLVFLPWDLIGESDWRSGFGKEVRSPHFLLEDAERIASHISRNMQKLFYIPAPSLPLFSNPYENQYIATSLFALAKRIGANILHEDTFALGSYLISGCAISGTKLSEVAGQIINSLTLPPQNSKKILVSDLDNVMWSGVIGEDGISGIYCQPEGRGWSHFLYQGMLRKLKNEGVLLAIVSRNDVRDTQIPFAQNDMQLGLDDFVAVRASYNTKSSQIMDIARQLDLSLDSFVFIDDNPVELAEVQAALPDVTCLAFPQSEIKLVQLFDELQSLFGRRHVTNEDLERTTLYKRRTQSIVPSDVPAANLKGFLKALDMRLEIHNCNESNYDRAIQLINKTNQFNLNGRRLENWEIDNFLLEGGSLFTATLSDRTGSHGEILACLISVDGIIESFAMSCRVLQRNVEHAFLTWLANRSLKLRGFRYMPTDRNEPLQNFLKSFAGDLPENETILPFSDIHNLDQFKRAFDLMTLSED